MAMSLYKIHYYGIVQKLSATFFACSKQFYSQAQLRKSSEFFQIFQEVLKTSKEN